MNKNIVKIQMSVLSADQIIKKILSVRTDLTVNNIKEIMEEKIKETGELLTREGAAYIVANELGINILNDYDIDTNLKIEDLVSGIGNATVNGRVLKVYPITTFLRSDGSKGKVGRLLIVDNTGTVNVVLWNGQTEVLESERIIKGQIIRVLHGYTRTGLDGKPEINLGSRGEIIIQPIDVNPEEYPEATDFEEKNSEQIKIIDLKRDMMNVDVIARVEAVGSVREFKRTSGQAGKVVDLLLKDSTGIVRLTIWDEQTKNVAILSPGDVIRVKNAYVRDRMGRIQLNLGKQGAFEANPLDIDPESVPFAIQELVPLGELMPNMQNVTVRGVITSAPILRTVTTSKGKNVKLVDFTLEDESGEVKTTIWRGLADVVDGLPTGSRIEIKNAYVREGLDGSLELSSSTITQIQVISRSEGFSDRSLV